MRLDHVTAAVADLGAAQSALAPLLGDAVGPALRLPGVDIVTFVLGEAELHLLAPTGAGVVAEHLDRHGPSLHHLALRVDSIEATLAAHGLRTLGPVVETAPGLREVFLDPGATAGLLVQLVERGAVRGALDVAAVSALGQALSRGAP